MAPIKKYPEITFKGWYLTFMAMGILVSSTGVKSEATFDRKDLSQAEKSRAAMKWFGIFFALAVFSVFVPILHFILVPSFLIAAVVVSMRAYNQKADLENVRGKCPNCSTEISIPRVRIRKVSGEICPQCRDFIKIKIDQI